MPRLLEKTSMIQARIDPRLREAAEHVFSKLGITTTEAIRLFFSQVKLHEQLPFPLGIPNGEATVAMAEANLVPMNVYRFSGSSIQGGVAWIRRPSSGSCSSSLSFISQAISR